MPNYKLLLFTLILIFTFGQVATDLYLPSLPNLIDALSTDTNMVQLSVTVYVASMMISQPIYGIASDGFGRKPMLLIGVILSAIGTAICISSYSIYTLLIGRFVQGLGTGVGATVCRAVVRDLFTGSNLVKAVSSLAVYGMAFMILAPIIGGYIEHYLYWQANFVLLLILNIISLIFLIIVLPETNKNIHKKHIKFKIILNNFISLLKSQNFMIYSNCSTIAFANIFAWITSGPIILQKVYGLSPIYFGWCYFIGGSFYILGNITNRYFLVKYNSNTMLIAGYLIQFLVGILIIMLNYLKLDNVFTIVILVGILMFGVSMIFPNSNAAALNDFTYISGTASALFSIMQSFGAVLSSSYIAGIKEENIIPVALCFIVLSAIGIIMVTYISIAQKEKLSA